MQDAKKDKYRYTEDGTLLVRKCGTLKWGAVDTMLPGREMWYQCSEKDPDRHLGKVVLMGWFGWHKFLEGSWASGFLYLMTCGCFGVFYLCDLIALIMGDYSYKEVRYEQEEKEIERLMRKVYYRPLENRRRGVLLLIPAVAILICAVCFIYQPLGSRLVGWTAELLSDEALRENLCNHIGRFY